MLSVEIFSVFAHENSWPDRSHPSRVKIQAISNSSDTACSSWLFQHWYHQFWFIWRQQLPSVLLFYHAWYSLFLQTAAVCSQHTCIILLHQTDTALTTLTDCSSLIPSVLNSLLVSAAWYSSISTKKLRVSAQKRWPLWTTVYKLLIPCNWFIFTVQPECYTKNSSNASYKSYRYMRDKASLNHEIMK